LDSRHLLAGYDLEQYALAGWRSLAVFSRDVFSFISRDQPILSRSHTFEDEAAIPVRSRSAADLLRYIPSRRFPREFRIQLDARIGQRFARPKLYNDAFNRREWLLRLRLSAGNQCRHCDQQ